MFIERSTLKTKISIAKKYVLLKFATLLELYMSDLEQLIYIFILSALFFVPTTIPIKF